MYLDEDLDINLDFFLQNKVRNTVVVVVVARFFGSFNEWWQ